MTLTYYLFPEEREKKYLAHQKELQKMKTTATDIWNKWTEL